VADKSPVEASENNVAVGIRFLEGIRTELPSGNIAKQCKRNLGSFCESKNKEKREF
jgi:hypothetical protein